MFEILKAVWVALLILLEFILAVGSFVVFVLTATYLISLSGLWALPILLLLIPWIILSILVWINKDSVGGED